MMCLFLPSKKGSRECLRAVNYVCTKGGNEGWIFTNSIVFAFYRPGFFWTFAQKLKVKKFKLTLKKLKTQEIFAQNSIFCQNFQKYLTIFIKILFKIRQNCSKTQEFTQNSRKNLQKPQFSGKSATLLLPENRPKKSLP